jgi:LemA protein
MKKTGIIILVIVGVLVLWSGCGYNGLVKADVEVDKGWQNVQTQYQRRADLIINLMETVKGAAANEKDILTSVTNARAGITEAKEGIGKANTPAEIEREMAKIQGAAMQFKLTVEAYPTVQSTAAFLKFQDELAGTENRISTVRTDYNAIVANYNIKIRRFPTLILAMFMGLKEKEGFMAKEGAEDAPKVGF